MMKKMVGVLMAGIMFLFAVFPAYAANRNNAKDAETERVKTEGDKNVAVEVGGQLVRLTSERDMGGSIYVAFYKDTGQMTSYKIYSADNGTVHVPSDENASYAKVMWWNQKMQPNCGAQTVSLKEHYDITYYIDNNDTYLQSLKIENPNPSVYFTEDGLKLKDLIVDGYSFKGWYTAQTGGERVTVINPGEQGGRTLYAHWEKQQYTVSFACDMAPVADIVYKTGEEKALPKPTLDKYTFIGWTDKAGKYWDSIPAGTAGNITLYANWVSNRNKAEPVKKLEDPIICVDSEQGLMLFTYEIGSIKNVPLFTILKLNCVNGIISTHSRTETEEISATQATQIAQTVSNATTNSSAITLAEDWNKSTQVSQSYLDQTGYTREEAETLAKSTSDTYRLTSDKGGSTSMVTAEGGTFKVSANVSHGNTLSAEKGQKTELSTHSKASGELSVGDDFIGAKVGAEIGSGKTDTNEIKHAYTGTSGWAISGESINERSKTTTDAATWNTSEGYESSRTASQSKTVAQTQSQIIAKQYGYGENYSQGGSNSESYELATSNSKSDEYSSALSYYTSKIKSSTTTFSSSGNTVGDYRLVMAGTVHVFGVVGYDIANKAFFAYTYSVLDDETEEYLDYSFDGTFDDYETGVLPFEVPYFVSEFVDNKLAKTEGLSLDPDTGIIVDYTPDPDNPDAVVVIPSFLSVDNHDGTFDAVKVKGIRQGLFKDNKDITAVQLGNYVAEIPDSAFEGCASLKYVLAPGVTKIGSRAFNGCTSLESFTLPKDVTKLGAAAFEGVSEMKADAFNADVAGAVASSGAKNIVLDISAVPDGEISSMALEIDGIDSFELQGKDKEYKGLRLMSNASSTVVNGVTFTENENVPMTFSSKNVVLDRVTADCTGYAMILKAEQTNLRLNRNVNLLSSGGNTVVTKNLNLKNLSNGIVGRLSVSGNVLVCGTVKGENYLTVSNGDVISVTAEEYENYLSSHVITFDPNGGTVAVDSKRVSLNMPVGELPVPGRDYYRFEGWFTQKEGGKEITAETVMDSLTDMTLYARWEQASVSAWTPVEDLPENAEVVDRKWTYTFTSYTTSNSPSLSGWEKYNDTWSWGGWSDWINWNPGTNNGSRQQETRWVDTSYYVHEYHYYAWVKGAWIYSYNAGGCHMHDIWVQQQLPYDSANGWFNGPRQSCCSNTHYYNAGDPTYSKDMQWERDRRVEQGYTQWRYRDKIFTYHFKKNENKESASDPSGQKNISNVREYVQYREK